MKHLGGIVYVAGLMAVVRAQDECLGSSQNGQCCPYGAITNGECCPYGNIIDSDCCMSYQASQGQSWGNIFSGGGQSCPDDAIAIPLDSPSYSSLLTSAASKLGITTISASASTATDASATATAATTSVFVSESTYLSASATRTGVASSTTSPTQGSTTSEASSISAASSTSTAAGAQITMGALPVGLVIGMGAYLI